MSRISIILAAISFVLFMSNATWSKTIHVKEGGAGDGSSWTNACGHLQDALDNAVPDDQIWVAAGTYKPTSDNGLGIGDRGKHFSMINHVGIYGGFPNTGDPGMADRDPKIYETVLSGDLLGNDEANINSYDLLDDPCRADNCFHVFYTKVYPPLESSTILDGFVITGGNASDTQSHRNGGGIYNELGSPVIRNCILKDNSSINLGGVFYSSASSNCTPTFINCVFINNFAYDKGGGIFCSFKTSPVLYKCTFIDNSAGTGGGISGHSSSISVRECNFLSNMAGYGRGIHGGGGGGIRIFRGTLDKCKFIGNFGAQSGGGIVNWGSVTITNCIFLGNSATYGGGIHKQREATVSNCIFKGNSAVYGGGIYCESLYNTNLINCTFCYNSANTVGG